MENAKKRIIDEIRLELEILHAEIQRFPRFILVKVERFCVEKRMVFRSLRKHPGLPLALTLVKNKEEEKRNY